MELVEFLRERLAEDEQAARAAYDEAGDYRVVGSELAELHFVRHKPDRVLAQVATLRAVVEDMSFYWRKYPEGLAAKELADRTLGSLAGIWADHPDYDPAWA